MPCRLKSIVIISYECIHNLAPAILYTNIVTQVSYASWKFMLLVLFEQFKHFMLLCLFPLYIPAYCFRSNSNITFILPNQLHCILHQSMKTIFSMDIQRCTDLNIYYSGFFYCNILLGHSVYNPQKTLKSLKAWTI